MKTANNTFAFSQKLIALAVFAACAQAQAQSSDDVAQLSKPDSTISVGAAVVSGNSRDRSVFGQYSGLRDHDSVLQLDIDYVRRDDSLGLWTTLQGRNLGRDNRDLRFSQERQGDWKYAVDYSELTRHDPRTVNTAMQGAGTTHPNVVLLASPGSGNDFNMELRRTGIGLGFEKWVNPSMQLQLSFKNEDKDGERLFGRGFTCTSGAAPLPTSASQVGCAAGGNQYALLLLPEPINSTTKQFEAKFNYFGDKLALSGGYYGSFYDNSNGTINPTVPGTLDRIGVLRTPAGAGLTQANGLQGILQLPMALPPDNQAHQFSLTGTYAFDAHTRANFKYAFTHATQDNSFLGQGLTGAPAGRSNLGGEIDTNLFLVGLSARPMPKLSVLANFRYEDRRDKTPIDVYNIEGTTTFTNGHVSNRRTSGKVEASYRFPYGIRGTAGVDYESIKRSIVDSAEVAGVSALRKETEETGARLELRRSMSDTLTGAVTYRHSRRTGSDWYALSSLDPANLSSNAGTAANQLALINAYCGGQACYGQEISGSAILALSGNTNAAADTIGAQQNAIFPMMLANRTRDTWKLSTDWTPRQDFSVQLVIQDNNDDFTSADNGGQKGLRGVHSPLYSVDATWVLSENWKLTGYASHGRQNQSVNHSTGYMADIKSETDSAGLGLTGKLNPKVDVGANLTYTGDTTQYDQAFGCAAMAAGKTNLTACNTKVTDLAATGGLPNVTYRATLLHLYGTYALDKNSGLRVDLTGQRVNWKEWTWNNNGTPFTFSDNTTVGLKQHQNVTFVGAAYVHKFQ